MYVCMYVCVCVCAPVPFLRVCEWSLYLRVFAFVSNFSVQAALRERVVQDGPDPGCEYADLPHGPRYVHPRVSTITYCQVQTSPWH